MPRLDGRSAIVTGGGMGMGRAIALRLAAEDAQGSVLDIDAAAAIESCGLIAPAGGNALPVVCDLSRAERIDAAVESHVAYRAGIDILVDDAGVMRRAHDLPDGTPDEAWAR